MRLGSVLLLVFVTVTDALAGMKGVEKSFDFGPRGGARVDYAAGYAEATALGTADVKRMVSSVQAEVAARRAARHLAYELLAETVGKVQVDAKTVYQDLLVQSDSLKTEVHGVIQGAQVLSETCEWVDDPLAGGRVPRATVTLRLPFAGQEGLVKLAEKHVPAASVPLPPPPVGDPAEAPPPPPEPAYDALVVDARGLGGAYEATLRPQVLDEAGRVVYAPEFVDPSAALARGGYVVYAASPEEAAALLGGEPRPLLVKALASPGKGQLAVARGDGDRVLRADASGRFRAAGRVAVLLPPEPGR